MKDKVRAKFCLSFLLAVACLPLATLSNQAQAQSSGTVTGKWHFVFETEGGPREFDATFQQDGEKVTGKWGTDADVKGTFSAGKLILEFPVNSEEAGPGTLKINGELAEEALTGTWSFNEYDGAFKATRSKPAAN